MPMVEASVEVHAPVALVYEQWTRFESFPEFLSGVESVSRRDDTHLHWVTTLHGCREEFDVEVSEQELLQGLAWRSAHGKEPLGLVRLHPLSDSSTRVMVQMASTAADAGETLQADLKRFKTLVERARS